MRRNTQHITFFSWDQRRFRGHTSLRLLIRVRSLNGLAERVRELRRVRGFMRAPCTRCFRLLRALPRDAAQQVLQEHHTFAFTGGAPLDTRLQV